MSNLKSKFFCFQVSVFGSPFHFPISHRKARQDYKDTMARLFGKPKVTIGDGFNGRETEHYEVIMVSNESDYKLLEILEIKIKEIVEI